MGFLLNKKINVYQAPAIYLKKKKLAAFITIPSVLFVVLFDK